MKINHDCIRAILLSVEKKTFFSTKMRRGILISTITISNKSLICCRNTQKKISVTQSFCLRKQA